MKYQQKWWVVFVLLVALALALVACGGTTPTETEEAVGEVEATVEAAVEEAAPEEEAAVSEEAPAEGASAGDKLTLGLWTHSAGNPNELAVIEQWVATFSAQSDQYEVVIESVPQESYNDSVAAASVAGSLPCINAISSPFAEYASLDELFRVTYEHEQLITQKINELAHAAMTHQDIPTFIYLQW